MRSDDRDGDQIVQNAVRTDATAKALSGLSCH
jgi:hypothetical protein